MEVGGTITGEHGVGVEKINQMRAVRRRRARALHGVKRAFDPKALLNPGKAVPTLARCAEYGACACTAASCRILSFRGFDCPGLPGPIRDAFAGKKALHLRGGGTKDFYGNALRGEVLDTRGYAGIVSYEPPSSWSRRVVELRFWNSKKRSMPMSNTCPSNRRISAPARRWAACCCRAVRAATRRAGALRDFVLGVKLIDGRGQVLAFGGQVMKNVAGYDVSRLAGSLGTLGLIAEVSLKLAPRREPRRRCVSKRRTSARSSSSTAGPVSRCRSAQQRGTTAS